MWRHVRQLRNSRPDERTYTSLHSLLGARRFCLVQQLPTDVLATVSIEEIDVALAPGYQDADPQPRSQEKVGRDCLHVQ